MAHFYGRLAWSGAQTVIRHGSKISGISAEAYSSDVGCWVDMHNDEGVDSAHIAVSTGCGTGYLPLMSCIREDERIICTIAPHISDTIVIKKG